MNPMHLLKIFNSLMSLLDEETGKGLLEELKWLFATVRATHDAQIMQYDLLREIHGSITHIEETITKELELMDMEMLEEINTKGSA